MLRHYLPSIAASIALLIAVLGVSFYPAPDAQPIKPFRASVVSAQQQCSDQTVGVSLLVEIETITPSRNENGITGFNAFGQKTTGDIYDPPVLLEKIGPIPCCFGLHKFFLDGTQVLEEGWVGGIDKSYNPGILFDKYEDHTANGAFGASPGTILPGSFIEYSKSNSNNQQTFNVSDLDILNAGSIKDLVGSAFDDSGSGNLKVHQIITISISGGGKVGVGDVNSNTYRDLSTGKLRIDTSVDDPNQAVFVCKDSQGNGVCDAEECNPVKDPLCSDGIDNDLDGKIDFPSDPGCDSPTDGDETNPACNDGNDNDGDGKIDFPSDIGCTSAKDDSEGNPVCSDGVDNDSDGKTDFPDDRGCESELDDDETNVPVDRTIDLQLGGRPQLIIQPSLDPDEVLIIEPPCPTCTVVTTPDHTQFVGGDPNTPDNFTIIAAFQDTTDPSGQISYTIIAVGRYEEHTDLYTFDGRPYIDILD